MQTPLYDTTPVTFDLACLAGIMRHDLDLIVLVGLEARDVDSTHSTRRTQCCGWVLNLIPVPGPVRGHTVLAQGSSIADPLARWPIPWCAFP